MISSGYINYIREIKSKDKILKIQIKILKKDISNLQKELIKNQIDKLEKIYPHTFVKEFRLYLKSHKIPFITKFPFNDYEGYIVMCFYLKINICAEKSAFFVTIHGHRGPRAGPMGPGPGPRDQGKIFSPKLRPEKIA